MQEIGGEKKYEALLADPKDPLWSKYWDRFEQRLKISVGLDDSDEMNEAVRRFAKCSLIKNPTHAQVQKFLEEYTEARSGMIEHGLLTEEPVALRREIEEFKNKIEGTALLTFLMQLPAFPTEFTATNEADFASTVMGRSRQFIKVPTWGWRRSERQQQGGAPHVARKR